MSLSDYIRAQADWRRQKAEEYPEDERNAQSATALDALADYVDEGAPDCGPWTLSLLEEQVEVSSAGTGVPMLGEQASRVISRYGFGYRAVSPWQHAEFLDDLVSIALLDAYEVAAAGAPDDDRSDEHLAELAEQHGLNPWEVEAALDGVHLDHAYFARRANWTEDEQEAAIASYRFDDEQRVAE